jgi:hypothetical protein
MCRAKQFGLKLICLPTISRMVISHNLWLQLLDQNGNVLTSNRYPVTGAVDKRSVFQLSDNHCNKAAILLEPSPPEC